MMADFPKELGEGYPMTNAEEESKTRDRILLEALVLFSNEGYAAVSVKDIAGKVGVQPGSLYNHFESKEALWYAVLDHIKGLYMMYFTRLDEAWKTAASFEDTLESMFVELKSVVNIFTYYAFSLVITEQFGNEEAGRLYQEVFLRYSIDYIKNRFDECVTRGWVKPFDTETVATFFMHSVLIGMTERVHADKGRKTAYDPTKMFEDLQRFILRAAQG